MTTHIDQAAQKVIKMNHQIEALKKRYHIANESYTVTLESLKLLTSRVTEAATCAGTYAAESLSAAKQVENAKLNFKSKTLLITKEEAEVAAETAARFAKEAVELAHEVLLTARAVSAIGSDVTAILSSMNSVLIALQSAEAATAAAKIAQSGTAWADFIALTPYLKSGESSNRTV